MTVLNKYYVPRGRDHLLDYFKKNTNYNPVTLEKKSESQLYAMFFTVRDANNKRAKIFGTYS